MVASQNGVGAARNLVITYVTGGAVVLLFLLAYVWKGSPSLGFGLGSSRPKILLKRFKHLEEAHFAYVGSEPPGGRGPAPPINGGGGKGGADKAETGSSTASGENRDRDHSSALPSSASKSSTSSPNTDEVEDEKAEKEKEEKKTSTRRPKANKKDAEEDNDESPIITLFTSQMTSREAYVVITFCAWRIIFNTHGDQFLPLPSANSLKNLAQRNVIMDYALLEPRVVPMVFTDDDDWAKFAGSEDVDAVEDFETNPHGTPTIRGFFNHAMGPRNPGPKTQFYAYANGDILFDDTLIKTLEGVSKAIKAGIISKKVLVVGKRTNHDITENEEIKDYESLEKIVMDLHNKGALFQANAEDYFIVTEGAIDWKAIPQFVIGRRAYDNWLVDHVYHKEGVDLVDATATLRTVHQTTAHGNFAGHRATPDSEWNAHLGQGNWDHGQTTDANFATRYRKGTSGEVIVVPSTVDPNSIGELLGGEREGHCRIQRPDRRNSYSDAQPITGHQAIAWLEEKLDHLDPATSVFVNFNSGGFSQDAVHLSAMVSAYHVISHAEDCKTRGKTAAAQAPNLHVHCFSPSGSNIKQRPSSMAPYEEAVEILKGLNLKRIDMALVKGRARPQVGWTAEVLFVYFLPNLHQSTPT